MSMNFTMSIEIDLVTYACICYFEIDPNKIGIYLTETEFYVLLIILGANLIYDYVRDNSEILFSTNEARFQLGYIVILHIYDICMYYMLYMLVFYLDILGDILIHAFVTSVT